MKKLFITIGILFIASTAFSAEYFVRQDGGSGGALGNECTGLVNAPYSGSGTNQPCAFDHPFRATSWNGGPAQFLQGGDTLTLVDDGTGFKMGYDNASSRDWNNNGDCSQFYSYDCWMKPLPSGTSGNPTIIRGSNHSTCSGVEDTAELWGTERVGRVINIQNTEYIDFECIAVTDHEECGYAHSNGSLACTWSNTPIGEDSAQYGIWGSDSSYVEMLHVYVYGLADTGIYAGRKKDWSTNNLHVYGNSFAGFDSDMGDPDSWSDSGNMIFHDGSIDWNGCIAKNQKVYSPTPIIDSSCHTQGQSGAGYGDGWAMSVGGAYDNDSLHYEWRNYSFKYNTSDGHDSLYKRTAQTTFDFDKIHAEGNRGNALKFRGTGTVDDSVLLANCYFMNNQPYVYAAGYGHCRSGTSAISWGPAFAGDYLEVNGSTMYSEWDIAVLIGEDNGSTCDNTEYVDINNSIIVGSEEQLYATGDPTYAFYNSGSGNCANIPFNFAGALKRNLIYVHGSNAYPHTGTNVSNANPNFVDTIQPWDVAHTDPLVHDVSLQAGSPALTGRQTGSGTSEDYTGYTRTNAIGALEDGSTYPPPSSGGGGGGNPTTYLPIKIEGATLQGATL